MISHVLLYCFKFVAKVQEPDVKILNLTIVSASRPDIVLEIPDSGNRKAYVDSSKGMLGTFGPQAEPYIHAMPEEVTPSGMFARGN
nr:hypothetical protein [Tanacetum cinerariifolium]